jgi:hypothetical protein
VNDPRSRLPILGEIWQCTYFGVNVRILLVTDLFLGDGILSTIVVYSLSDAPSRITARFAYGLPNSFIDQTPSKSRYVKIADAPAHYPFADTFGLALACLLNRTGGEATIAEEELRRLPPHSRIVEMANTDEGKTFKILLESRVRGAL